MHAQDRAPMSYVIRDLEQLRDQALEYFEDDLYYAYARALAVLKQRFPEAFESRNHISRDC